MGSWIGRTDRNAIYCGGSGRFLRSVSGAPADQKILPNANESFKLAELAYEVEATSFFQRLVARRTYFDSSLQLVAAQTLLAQTNSKVDGFMLTGGLDPVVDHSGDDSLRELAFGQR